MFTDIYLYLICKSTDLHSFKKYLKYYQCDFNFKIIVIAEITLYMLSLFLTHSSKQIIQICLDTLWSPDFIFDVFFVTSSFHFIILMVQKGQYVILTTHLSLKTVEKINLLVNNPIQ